MAWGCIKRDVRRKFDGNIYSENYINFLQSNLLLKYEDVSFLVADDIQLLEDQSPDVNLIESFW